MNDLEQENQENNQNKTEETIQPVLEKPAKRKSRFGLGVLAGVVLSAVLIIGGTLGVCKFAGVQLVIGGRGASTVKTTNLLNNDAVSKIKELTEYMDLYYYDDYDEETVRDKMYAGLVEGLGDKYSVYYNPEEYQDLQVSTTGTYYGIGAGLSQDPDTMQVTITKVYEGTPSEEAGLKKDDVILKVDDIEGNSMEVSELVKHIRGEEGTSVHLEIYRPSTEETLEFDVERRNVELPSISSQMFDNHIGYIQIAEFQKGTAAQFETALDNLKEQGMESLIVDVRSNPGGLVPAVVQILDDILPEGIVVYTEDKYGNRQDYTSSGDTYLDCPIAVLVDENSASASEIFAGAIQDYHYGTLIGTTTFGKGIVQTIYPLSDGDALKITTAKYFTPSGNYIHGKGITPDIELDYEFLGSDTDEYAPEFDNQIQKAIEVLQ